MAIAKWRKCSSETQDVPAGRVIKVVEAAVEYAQWLFKWNLQTDGLRH